MSLVLLIQVFNHFFDNTFFVCREVILFQFSIHKAVWNTILAKDDDYLWKVLEESYKDIPDWASWINFLRNHDELTLEMTKPELRKTIHKKLVGKGSDFRQGFGVAGRTASFLDGDERRIVNAYLILASLPGCPAIIYGDEIGKLNDIDYMKQQTESKSKRTGEKISDDTRDMNRGKITPDDLKGTKAKYIYSQISNILNARKAFNISNRIPKKINTDNRVIAGEYETFKFFINLSDEKVELKIDSREPILKVNEVGGKIKLGAYAGIWI